MGEPADEGSERGNAAEDAAVTRQRRVLLVASVVAFLVVLVAAWAWIEVPALYPPYLPSPGVPPLSPEVAATRDGDRAQAIVSTRASVLAALAGLGALVTIAINLRNSNTALRTAEIGMRGAEIAARTLSTTQETFRITERGHLIDRYTKAIEQLGHETSIAIRLGGIYALQQLAVDTDRDSDQAAVVEVLSAFVRLNLHADLPEGHQIDNPMQDAVPPRADVLATISVLAQLPVRVGAPMRADFTGISFHGLLLGESRLRLQNADLAEVNLRRARLAGADLTGANLTGAVLTCVDLTGATLTNARLAGAHLTGENVSNPEYRSADGTWGVHLTEAILTGADLTGACITPAANLARAQLQGACLVEADLIGADLTGARLDGADLSRAELRQATLVDANLSKARLVNTQLRDCDLTRANFSGAHLCGGNFHGADLAGADLAGADLTGANITADQLAVTIGEPLRGPDGHEAAAAPNSR